jgi:sec-independent protein translocase protein TatA
MFGLQGPELIIILVLVLIIFGAGKLPQVFGSLGKGVKEFRSASEGNDTPTPPATSPPTVTTTPPNPTDATAGMTATSATLTGSVIPPTPNTVSPSATQQESKRAEN